MASCTMMINNGTNEYTRKNRCTEKDPLVFSLSNRKNRNNALDASNAPVIIERIKLERAGNAFERWNDEMYMNGPPRARKKYPVVYASNARYI